MTEAEWRTRRERVDRRLKDAGWTPRAFRVGEPLAQYGTGAVEEYPTTSGPADYALIQGGDPLAVIEAKKVSLGPRNALTQVLRYARGLEPSRFDFDGIRVPFGYSTNGEQIYFQDLRRADSYSRRVSRFHTPSALGEYLNRNDGVALDWLATHPNEHARLRAYQREATDAIEGAIRAVTVL